MGILPYIISPTTPTGNTIVVVESLGIPSSLANVPPSVNMLWCLRIQHRLNIHEYYNSSNGYQSEFTRLGGP